MLIVILEAFAAGLPVIASDFGTTGLQIEDGVHYMKANRSHEFVDAIARAVAQPRLCREVATRGNRYVREHFSTSIIAARWKDRILARLSQGEGDEKTWEVTITPVTAKMASEPEEQQEQALLS